MFIPSPADQLFFSVALVAGPAFPTLSALYDNLIGLWCSSYLFGISSMGSAIEDAVQNRSVAAGLDEI